MSQGYFAAVMFESRIAEASHNAELARHAEELTAARRTSSPNRRRRFGLRRQRRRNSLVPEPRASAPAGPVTVAVRADAPSERAPQPVDA